ncbi:hypothetical protein HAX54_008739, partial [Datura stramonium]|nr:hypothetical protein [Datura stramonium]
NFGLPKLSVQIEDEIDEVFGANSDDGIDAMEEQGTIPIPENISEDVIIKFMEKIGLVVLVP